MNHALSAVVMVLAGVLFTSCTATVVQQWATARPVHADYVPPTAPGSEHMQAIVPASAEEQCRTDPSKRPQAGPMVPKFSPIRRP